MVRMRYALLLLFCVYCLLIGPFVSIPGAPSPVLAAGGTVTAEPGTLSATVPLGQQQQLDLTLTNTTAPAAATIATLYEAQAGPTPGVNLRQTPPPSLRRAGLPNQAIRVDPRISARLAAAPTGRTEFLVFLNDQADLSAAYSISNWSDRGWAVYHALHDQAEQSQAGIKALLDARGTPYRSFWIVNALAVQGTQADVQTLNNRAEVALLTANTVSALPPEEATADTTAAVGIANCSPDVTDNNSPTCWSVRKIGADRVWHDFGISGQGVTVANIDTGVRYTHNALEQQYRGYRGPGSFDHRYNWFDPEGIFAEPTDNNGHGSHTMGSMVGRGDGTPNQPAVGVAPGADWIAAQGCDNRDCSEDDLIAAAQWLVAPTDPNGANPRPDLRPQIINNSWAGSSSDDWYTGYVAAWRAAGIFPVFAAGNSGPSCGSIQSPGDYADVLGVGSTTLSDAISSFSAAGPTKDGRLKPDVSAPGSQILSTVNGSNTSYGILSGTSMAAPHVAGLVALLWSANPALVGDYDSTYALLNTTAMHLNDQHCGGNDAQNNVFGYGRVDAYAAVAQARVDVPWLSLAANQVALSPNGSTKVGVTVDTTRIAQPGTYQARVLVQTGDLSQQPTAVNVTLTVTGVTGQASVIGNVHDARTGAPLNASVRVVNGATTAVDKDGNYSIVLPTQTAPYTLIASATGYLESTATITLSDSLTLTQAFSLTTDLQELAVSTDVLTASLDFGQSIDLPTTIQNIGTQPLSYTASIPNSAFGVWPSDDPLGPTYKWVTATNEASLTLTDDGTSDKPLNLGFNFPFYGQTYSEVYVNANGMLTFDPSSASSFSGGCLPVNNVASGAIVPFHADLDPSQGGSIRYASTSEGFVVTFDQVPLHSTSPSSDVPTYSFQTILKPDGRIVFQYGQLGLLPSTLAVGVQRASYDAQTIGCGRTTPVKSGLALELRSQPSTDQWAGLVGVEGTVASGAQAQLVVRLRWVRPDDHSTQPLRGTVVINSDDPRQPEARIPFTLTTTAATYETRLPIIMR